MLYIIILSYCGICLSFGRSSYFNFERLRVRAPLQKKVEAEKSECNNLGYKLTGLTWWP